jgi:hypothetical protein
MGRWGDGEKVEEGKAGDWRLGDWRDREKGRIS